MNNQNLNQILFTQLINPQNSVNNNLKQIEQLVDDKFNKNIDIDELAILVNCLKIYFCDTENIIYYNYQVLKIIEKINIYVSGHNISILYDFKYDYNVVKVYEIYKNLSLIENCIMKSKL